MQTNNGDIFFQHIFVMFCTKSIKMLRKSLKVSKCSYFVIPKDCYSNMNYLGRVKRNTYLL